MPQKTKAELQVELDETRETVQRYYDRIRELEGCMAEGVEKSSVYQQALRDAEAARSDAAMWRELYESLEAKQNKPPVKMGRPVKVTDSMRQEIRDKRSQGASIRDLAREYGVAIASIQRAIKD